jgi:hypothetical protein
MKTARFAVTTLCFIVSAAAVVALKNVDIASAQQTKSASPAATSDSSTPPTPKTSAKSTADQHDTTAIMGNKVNGTRVYFVSPKDGATVTSPVALKFGVDGYQVKPSGNIDALTGHHHLIIDGTATPEGEIVPADATHVHYGKGQTEASLKLSPGPHKLTLQFADGGHKSYGPGMSSTIHITVK